LSYPCEHFIKIAFIVLNPTNWKCFVIWQKEIIFSWGKRSMFPRWLQ
jgi:hypothetical protein